MPDVNKKEPPSSYTILKVYQLYLEELKPGSVPLSRIQFRRMWKKSFSEVIIPKTNRFTKCGVCVLLHDQIKSSKTKESKLEWLNDLSEHLELQSGERQKYQYHQNKAEKNPEKYLSVIIDGMDQSKTHLPHWHQISKLEGEYAEFMKTHVTGILSHGANMAMCFIDFLRWPQDANPTMNCLISHFRQLSRKNSHLPPVLYLQLDNCYSDCKNIYIMGFCALLVKVGVFKKVRLSYLMVGHTHEDIDQVTEKKKDDAIDPSLSARLNKVWVSVYDDKLTDEQIERLPCMHNYIDEGSRITPWIDRVKTCRAWAYRLAKSSEKLTEKKKDAIDPSLSARLDKVWVSVYDDKLTDEQIKRLAYMHNCIDEGSRITPWIDRVKTCRAWAYRLAKRDLDEPTPDTSSEWRKSCHRMFDVASLEPTLQAALLAKPVWEKFVEVADLYKKSKLKDMVENKPSRRRSMDIKQTQVYKRTARCFKSLLETFMINVYYKRLVFAVNAYLKLSIEAKKPQ
ncbi:hypothetical protein AC249_AIPGENE6470 [Exaiptasia diaphana]|nr:hypothetical protein AC249_AIPGENE6470 [Exaiptasia diaphana]